MLTIQRQIWNKPSKFESQETEHLLLLELSKSSNENSSDNLYQLELYPFNPQYCSQRGEIAEVVLAYPELKKLQINEDNQVIVKKQKIGSKLVLIIKVNVFQRDVLRDKNNGEKEVIAIDIKNEKGNSQIQEVFKIHYTSLENKAQIYHPEVEQELAQYYLTSTVEDNNIIEDNLESRKLESINESLEVLDLEEPIDFLTLKLEELIYAQNNWSYVDIDYIDKKRALDLKILDLSNSTLTNEDLQGVEQFPNITTLIVGRNSITKLEFINNYKKLQHLTIIGKEVFNYICSYQPLILLSQFKELREIILIDNNLSDLKFVKEANLQHLNKLILDDNQITDLQPLSQLTALEYLSVANNKIQSIDCLKKLSNLKNLILRNNQIGNIKSYWRQFNKLIELDLKNNKITDLRPFTVMKSLKKLNISSNPIQTIRPLQGLFLNLEELEVCKVNLTSKISEKLENLQIQQLETVTVNNKGEEIARNQFSVFFREIVIAGSIKLSLVPIPKGEYMMGEGYGQKLVKVEEFWMSQYQITQEQWDAVANLEKIGTELDGSPSNWKGKKLPVEKVTWSEAQEFCRRLSKKTGEQFRLPTKEEWEYACRAGTTTPFYFGETITSELANFNGRETHANEPQGAYRERTTDVGIFPPNAFGLYDMHGNVSEWCNDNFDGDKDIKVIRGGYYQDSPSSCRSAFRSSSRSYGAGTGFRIVIVPPKTLQ
ncbi:MAG: SUMF1/EgtB/PvdO family nonheme iron enzyme [Trichodesmium sp. ALOHA_ZT_67]|nr:SUMF1/EgtB/PvdO family nonheme iron enzyme [Trichodesmium sp. ALOHA_ZT_67]